VAGLALEGCTLSLAVVTQDVPDDCRHVGFDVDARDRRVAWHCDHQEILLVLHEHASQGEDAVGALNTEVGCRARQGHATLGAEGIKKGTRNQGPL